MSWWWSWLLAGVGLAGLWLAGSRRRAGWALGVSAQGLWIAYALATAQYGFILAACGYGIVYARNWWRWRGPAPHTEPGPEPDPVTARGVSALHQPTAPASHPNTMISPTGQVFHPRNAREAAFFSRWYQATPLHPRQWPYPEYRP